MVRPIYYNIKSKMILRFIELGNETFEIIIEMNLLDVSFYEVVIPWRNGELLILDMVDFSNFNLNFLVLLVFHQFSLRFLHLVLICKEIQTIGLNEFYFDDDRWDNLIFQNLLRFLIFEP